MGQSNAKLNDPLLSLQAGFNPKTGLPLKFDNYQLAYMVNASDIKRGLEIIDRQDAINRYQWYNLPEGLNERMIERVLYFRGQGALFTYNDKFYFLPYALDGDIDCYGRYLSITPLIFNGSSGDSAEPWVNGKSFTPVYDPVIIEDFEEKSEEELEAFLSNSCVLLRDYTEGIPQRIIPRVEINKPIINLMSQMFPLLRTNLIISTGVRGIKVSSEDEEASIVSASNAMTKSAIEGKPYIGIVGGFDFQDLTNGNIGKCEEYLLAMQSIDNYRLSLYGLSNGGLFQKKSHILEAEQDMNNGNVGLIYKDGLELRREFATIVNSIWGTNIWVESSETVANVDMNGDGIADDEDSTLPNDEGGTMNE